MSNDVKLLLMAIMGLQAIQTLLVFIVGRYLPVEVFVPLREIKRLLERAEEREKTR